jgi:hypothetical protein
MRILSSIHPSTNQKRIIAKILAAANPKLAGEAMIGNPNEVAARDMLIKLGIINFAGGEASLTDKGMQIAQEEGLTDEAGGLSDVGSALVGAQPEAPEMPQQQPEMPQTPPMEAARQVKRGALLKELFSLQQ